MTSICESCKKEDETVKDTTVKEDGVVGYYDRNVTWCEKCVDSHNYYLMANWG